MSAFSIERTSLGHHDIVVLHDHVRGRSVRIAQRGATVIGLEVSHAGQRMELADGFRDAGELDSRPSSRFAIMAPFANRIEDARYHFDGVEHDLTPGATGDKRASRHGFVRALDFDIGPLDASDEAAYATFTSTEIRPDRFAGYPFAIDVAVTYTLDERGLTLDVYMRNVGEQDAPCFFGWHPYFRFDGGAVDSWELQVPAKQMIRTSDALIPLPGKQAYVPLDQAPPELDFRQRKAIGSVHVDNGYCDLVLDDDGRARTVLRDPASGLQLSMWQESGIVLVFTADTVTRDVRKSVAIEPMESLSNAFNRDDCADTIRLKAGGERRYRCGVELP